MIVSIVNARAVQPFVPVATMVVKKNETNMRPAGVSTTVDATEVPVSEIDLPRAIPHIGLVAVYVDGFRLLNVTTDFGATYSSYTVAGNKITFKSQQTGIIEAFLELPMSRTVPVENTLVVKNVQGAKSANKTANTMLASYFCEPVILTLPVNGKVCLSDDRKSILYFPDQGYEGFDAFSYTVISDRGQVADPKCVNIKVGNAKPKG